MVNLNSITVEELYFNLAKKFKYLVEGFFSFLTAERQVLILKGN